MTPHQARTDGPYPADRYRIRLAGRLDDRSAACFDGFRLSHEDDGSTVLDGPVIDQAALHGLLRHVRDAGLPLVSVMRVARDRRSAPTALPGQPSRERDVDPLPHHLPRRTP